MWLDKWEWAHSECLTELHWCILFEDSFIYKYSRHLASLMAQMVKRLPAMQETWVWSLGWEDPLEKEMATHSSILGWKISHGWSLVGYSPWGCKESDTTERLHFTKVSQSVSSVAQLCPTLCDPVNRSTPALPCPSLTPGDWGLFMHMICIFFCT